MRKIFEPLKLEIYYFDEKDSITCSFTPEDNELPPVGGFDSSTGEFV